MREIDFVIPAFNEVENLECLTQDIIRSFEKIGVKNFAILIVENGSDDGSADLIKKLNNEDPRILGIVLSRNFGPQGAIHAGLTNSQSEFVCVMDGDQQDPPEDAAKMYTAAKDNEADVVYAVRVSREEKYLRKLGFKTFYKVWSFFSDIDVPKDAGEFSVMRKPVVDTILSLPEVHRFNRGLRSWSGFKQIAYSHHRPDRVAGDQKFNFSKDLMLGLQAVLSFSLMPIRIILLLGALLAVLSFSIMALNGFAIFFNALGMPSLYNALPKGLISLNLISLFFQGVVFIALGIIGEYVGRIYEQSKGRPTFVVRSIIGTLHDKK